MLNDKMEASRLESASHGFLTADMTNVMHGSPVTWMFLYASELFLRIDDVKQGNIRENFSDSEETTHKTHALLQRNVPRHDMSGGEKRVLPLARGRRAPPGPSSSRGRWNPTMATFASRRFKSAKGRRNMIGLETNARDLRTELAKAKRKISHLSEKDLETYVLTRLRSGPK